MGVGGVWAGFMLQQEMIIFRKGPISRTTDLPLDRELAGSLDLWFSAHLGLLSVVLGLGSSLLGPLLQDVSLGQNLSPSPSSLDVTVLFVSSGSFSLDLDLVLDGLSQLPLSVDLDLELFSSEGTSLDPNLDPPSLLDLSLEATSGS